MKKHRFVTLVSRRFFWLLLLLGAFILLAGQGASTGLGKVEGGVALMAILTMVGFATRARRGRLLATILLNLLPVAAWSHYAVVRSELGLLVCHLSLLACLIFAIYCTLDFVLTNGLMTGEHILGGICGYILIAMFYATVYTMLWIYNGKAFAGMSPNSGQPWGELVYFSFTTLSTVGYGDIAPAAPMARGVATLEQLTGTFYLAVLIARLTGLYPPKGSAPGEKGDAAPGA